MLVTPSTRNTTSPGVFVLGGYTFSRFRPTILEIMISVVSSAEGHVPTYWPSRITLTSSEMRRISSILWLM